MDKGVMEKYEQGITLFEEGRYEDAVACLIDAYESGYMQTEIIRDIYNCFVIPNSLEFQDNYNAAGVERYGIQCEDTLIDFIPVEEYKFYLWHKKQEKFLGLYDVKNAGRAETKSFQSILIADGCNVEKALALLEQKQWNNIYVLLQGQKSEFLSFCKLPLFFNKYLEHALFFKSEEEMKAYFKDSENYLPHMICADNEQYYNELFEKIHIKRISGSYTEERKNIFLSICIPTWNRGLSALNAVKNILAASYDAEIEVVVSNNGSDKTEGYDELKEIKDLRLRYYELESNMGFAYNFRNVLGKAKGRFAVMSSDEDLLNLEELPKYLDFLFNNMDVRILTTSGVGPNFRDSESHICLPGIESNVRAINTNYITGITFNINYMRENKIFEKYDELSNLTFIYWYAQCTMAAITTKGGTAAFFNVKLWQEDGTVQKTETDKESGMLQYMKLENRIKQQNDAVEFCKILYYDDDQMFVLMMCERMYKTYILLNVGFCCLPKEFMNEYNWLEVCLSIYDSHMKLLSIYLGKDEVLEKRLKQFIYDKGFCEFILENPLKPYQTEEENLIQEKTALAIKEKIMHGILPKDISVKAVEKEIKTVL